MTMYSLSNGAAAYRSLHFGLIILTWCNCSVVVFVVADVRGRHFLLADVAGFPVAVPGQTDGRLPTAAHLLAQLHVEAELVLQERQKGHLLKVRTSLSPATAFGSKRTIAVRAPSKWSSTSTARDRLFSYFQNLRRFHRSAIRSCPPSSSSTNWRPAKDSISPSR